MKQILVPIDFSTCSLKALKVAVDISLKSGSEILLLNVLDYSSHITSVFDAGVNESMLLEVFGKLKKESEKKIEEIISHYPQSVKFNSNVEVGLPRDVIMSMTKSPTIELIVMGTKGTSGVSEVFVGSNTERIVRESKIPVLTVSESTDVFTPNTIVYASDFEEKAGGGFQEVIWFASLYDAEIKLVRINTPNNFLNTVFAEKAMHRFAHTHSIKKYSVEQFDYEQFEPGLNKYVNRIGADMIAMGTHGRSGFNYFYFGGSKAEDVVNHFDIPVFTFRIN